MSDYTPTTDKIEDAWCYRYDGKHSWSSDKELRGYGAEFDRWFDQVRAEAWDEGYGEQRECCGICPSGACPWDNNKNGPTNPYRKEQGQ